MAGLNSDTPIPTEITLRQQSRCMEIAYDDARYELSYEFLRVLSPSAEARGHGPGQDVLQVGKRDVGILRIEPVGNYAIRLTFSDGHSTGIYSWDALREMAKDYPDVWATYIRNIEERGMTREG